MSLLKKKLAKKMKLHPRDEENLRENTGKRNEYSGVKIYKYPEGTYKRKGDRYIKQD